jgi:protein MpaA
MRRALLIILAVAAAAPAGAAASALPSGRHVVLGRSAQGRAIRAVRLGDPGAARKAVVVGSIHGDERGGLAVTGALRRAARARDVDLWVIDSVNPDGLRRHTRQNARGVDLNRNFPYRWRRSGSRGARYWGGPRPLSEPESRLVRRWLLRIRPAVTIWYHQPWGAVLVPCHGAAPVERRYARRARMPVSCRGEGLRGTVASWQNHALRGGHAFVVELPAGRVSRALARRNARAALAAARGL